MKCLNPISVIDNRDYEIENNFDKRIYLPCGKCEACRNADSRQWRIRLKEEFYNSENAFFLTLTYDDSTLPYKVCTDYYGKSKYVPVVNKRDIQLFIKKLRFRFEEYYKKRGLSLKYFLVSEYGPTNFRPHYHCILFNLPVLSSIPQVNIVQITKEIQKIWNNGFIKLDKCNENRIGYCTKYMSCETIIPEYLPKPFRLISKGIGKVYLTKSERILWHKKDLNNYYPDGNFKCKLPRYYKDKIFSEDEKVMIRQLNSIRISKDNNHAKFMNMSEDDFNKFKTSIDKFKRDYKNKNLKNRKF